MATPTYYYYSGLLCGGGIQVLFRSTDFSLSDHCAVAKAYCEACGGTVQCFDNVSPSLIPNYNDLIACYETCTDCYNDNPDTSPTPSATPVPPTATPPPPPPCDCTYYNIVVTSHDIDSSTGNTTSNWNNTVWVRYYDCDTRGPIDTYYDAADNYYHAICNNNLAGTPYLYYHIDDSPSTVGITSTITNSTDCCPPPTPTPTTTQLNCGEGITTGSYYYTDCCGNFIQGTQAGLPITLDYSKATNGVTKLYVNYAANCITPTPTPTSTTTSTPTITPTITATPSLTPTLTPSLTPTSSNLPVYKPQNDCTVFTLFDLGLICNVISIPSSPTANDGVLSLNVTGGTSPYSFYWDNGQRNQTLMGISGGTYQCTVIDYYGDYTATTICGIFAPSATPTPTITATPTVTPSSICPKLCFIAISNDVSYGPWQFICNGMYNGKTTWSNGTYNIIWNNTNWEIVEQDMTTPFISNGGGIFASTTTSNIPTALWQVIGGTTTYSVTMTEGECPASLPLQVNVTYQNSTCNGTQNCDGSITIAASYGKSPYMYSINNGLTWQTSNFFFNLCPNTYTTLVRDSANATLSNVVTVGYNQPPTTYQLSFKLVDSQTNPATNTNSEISHYNIISTPVIPAGVTIQANLDFSSAKIINGPGSGVITNGIIVLQDGVNLSPTNPQSTNTSITRPNCSPEIQTTTTETETYSITLSNSSTIVITSSSSLVITNGQISTNSCVTQLEGKISGHITNPVINGCSCCVAVAGDTVNTTDVTASYQQNGTSLPTPIVTTTPTPLPCNCTSYTVVITSEDLNSATGNSTSSHNNVVFALYYDCITGSHTTTSFTSSGEYPLTICNNNTYGIPYLFIYMNNAVSEVMSSTIVDTLTTCCVQT